jgi:hypothetical protein
MPLRGRVGRHSRDGGRHCQNWPDDQQSVIRLLNRMPVAAGGAAGSLSKPVISGICSDELYRAITTFEDKYFPGERKGYVDPAGVKHMEDLAAASLRARIDFVTPVEEDGSPTGATKVISGTTRDLISNHVMFVGIVGDRNNVVKTVSPNVPTATTIEDVGVVGGNRWFRLSRPLGHNFTLQAKDAKGTVLTSFEVDIIELPKASGPIELGVEPADPKFPNRINLRVYAPKDDADYVDTRMTGVGYSIYLGGFQVYCTGMSLYIEVPNSLVDLNPTKFEPIDAKVYGTLAQANEAIRRAPAKAKGVMPFAYYRGGGGAVIAPTIFSAATTPRIIATLWEARRLLAESVQRDLASLAIGIVGGMVFRAIPGRFLRAGSGDPEPPRAALPRLPEPPAMTRLRNTASDALKKNPLRTAEVLSSPRVYRHSLTAQNPPASYALIEKEGSMKLSDIRGNAHYGEGVYAWPAGSDEAGKYIDIEVPPGTGVETLKVGNETWVRMVPPNGNRLPVKIVGSNLSPAQIEWGKKLAKPLSGD